jgi:hypothetical protein
VLPQTRVGQAFPEVLQLGPEAAPLLRLPVERGELPLELRHCRRHQPSSRKRRPLRQDWPSSRSRGCALLDRSRASRFDCVFGT